jgi:La-related protein 7
MESIPPLLSSLKNQMEFYFSDSNLRNDKFLKSLLSQHPKGYVDLHIFLRFNKIKAIFNKFGDDFQLPDPTSFSDNFKFLKNEGKPQEPSVNFKIESLQKAIINSKLLKLSKSKKKVRRIEKFDNDSKNYKKVIYVENFPVTLDHEGLAKIFEKAGKPIHVSIPKYGETKAVKGFAFIEFQVRRK